MIEHSDIFSIHLVRLIHMFVSQFVIQGIEKGGNVVPRKQLKVAENKWSDWKITHFLIFMSNYQFLWCNAHIGAWKCYCDTPARFRVLLVMINTLLKMTENFWFPEIWLIVPRKEKIFLCPEEESGVFCCNCISLHYLIVNLWRVWL